jgi:hypothetical protein
LHNTTTAGTIRIGTGGSTPLTTGGELVVLTFVATGSAGSSTALTFTRSDINEMPVAHQDGMLRIVAPTSTPTLTHTETPPTQTPTGTAVPTTPTATGTAATATATGTGTAMPDTATATSTATGERSTPTSTAAAHTPGPTSTPSPGQPDTTSTPTATATTITVEDEDPHIYLPLVRR